MSDSQEQVNQGPAARLAQILEELAERGMKQRDVAMQLTVPPQYLSDVRHGRRPVSELFAHRFSEAFRVSAAWLLHGEGPRDLPYLAGPASADAVRCQLPVLSAPDVGDPRQSSYWDGTELALAGAATVVAARTQFPFVLRVSTDLLAGRLRKNDLVLCCLESREDAALVIVQHKGKVQLAQSDGRGRYTALASGRSLPGAEAVGCCLAIVWAPLGKDR